VKRKKFTDKEKEILLENGIIISMDGKGSAFLI